VSAWLPAPERQVVKTLDKRDAFQPLVLERLDDPLGYGNGPVLSYPYISERREWLLMKQ